MFANIRKLTKNKCLSIQADCGFMSCDIILLSECYTKVPDCHHLYKIDGYKMLSATGDSRPLSSNGQVCYVNQSSKEQGILEFIAHNADSKSHHYNNEFNRYIHSDDNPYKKDMVEISMFKYTNYSTKNEIHIIQIYNHPDHESENPENDMRMKNLIGSLKIFLDNHPRVNTIPMLIFGDFNIDFNNTRKRDYWNRIFADDYGLKPTLINTCTRPRPFETVERQLDWVFTNKLQKDVKTLPYSTYFSDHIPLYTAIENL